MTPRLRTIVRPNGERLPLLLSSDGVPVFYPTLYSLSQLRARNLSRSAIAQHLRAIAHFQIFAEIHDIDIDKRLRKAMLLTPQEIDSLARSCHQPAKELALQLRQHQHQHHAIPPLRRLEFPQHIPGPRAKTDTVHPTVARTRLHSIQRYLEWLAHRQIYASSVDPEHRADLKSALEKTLSALDANSPRKRHYNANAPRHGLSKAEIEEMFATTRPGAPQNPWRDPHTQVRNWLIIQWFFQFGLRRGELLALRVPDINFQEATVEIVPRPHNSLDPRRDQPLVKTLGRTLPLTPELLDLTYTYVIEHRPFQGHARRHDFLLVASQTGSPLSIMAISKLFEKLRDKNRNLPPNLSAHILRHTWNDRFSELMDQQRTTQANEQKLRAIIMGWSETSTTAANYTRRYTQELADRALLDLHRSYTTGENDGP